MKGCLKIHGIGSPTNHFNPIKLLFMIFDFLIHQEKPSTKNCFKFQLKLKILKRGRGSVLRQKSKIGLISGTYRTITLCYRILNILRLKNWNIFS